jgi:hypothetical protein
MAKSKSQTGNTGKGRLEGMRVPSTVDGVELADCSFASGLSSATRGMGLSALN